MENLHAKAAIVHKAVVMGAKLHQVIERSGAAIRPVLDVMTV